MWKRRARNFPSPLRGGVGGGGLDGARTCKVKRPDCPTASFSVRSPDGTTPTPTPPRKGEEKRLSDDPVEAVVHEQVDLAPARLGIKDLHLALALAAFADQHVGGLLALE